MSRWRWPHASITSLVKMGQPARARCRTCNGHRSEVGEISWAGYCIRCGVATRDAANDDLHYHRGPTFEKWRRAMAACVGAVLVEDAERQ